MSEDLYAVLGLEKNASETEIKKAYRRLARQYHPDINKEAGADKQFKRIQKSYDILSNPQKKAQYDQFGVADDSVGGGAGWGGGAGFEGFSDSFDDIFESFFGGSRRGGQSRSGPVKGDDLRYDLDLTLDEVFKGVTKHIDVYHLEKCSRCKGDGSQPGTEKSTCHHCQGQGQVKTVQRTMLGTFSQVTTCPHCQGSGEIVKNPCLICHGKGLEKKKKNIKVDIPRGVDKGIKLRVSGEGNCGEKGGPSGDLYVFISVNDHDYFERKGDDVYVFLELPLTQVVLGTKIEVPILGGVANLTIPSGTQPGTTFRLKGKGVPHLQGFGSGDQYVQVQVKVPPKLTRQERTLVEQLAKLRNEEKPASSILDFVKRNV